MAVLLKRTDPEMHIRNECPWRCCTDLYGKSVKLFRRKSKRRARQDWKKAVKFYA